LIGAPRHNDGSNLPAAALSDATSSLSAGRLAQLRSFLALPPKVLLVLLLTALVSAVVFGVSELAAGRVNEIRAEAMRLRQIAIQIVAIREATLHAESAQRGYLLTMDRRYLEPFKAKATQATVDSVFRHAAKGGAVTWENIFAVTGQRLQLPQNICGLT